MKIDALNIFLECKKSYMLTCNPAGQERLTETSLKIYFLYDISGVFLIF